MKTLQMLDAFTTAYLVCALWSSTDDEGAPLDANYQQWDIAPETLERMTADCEAFQAANAELLSASELSTEQQGHDLWLSRNGHGAGFFDRCSGTGNEAACDALQLLAKQCGEFDLYVGDDGKIYGN